MAGTVRAVSCVVTVTVNREVSGSEFSCKLFFIFEFVHASTIHGSTANPLSGRTVLLEF